jgi:hypothetical protein
MAAVLNQRDCMEEGEALAFQQWVSSKPVDAHLRGIRLTYTSYFMRY